VVAGSSPEVVDFASNLNGRVRVIADERARLTTKYGVGVFPFALAVDENGIVRRKAIVNSGRGLESLVGTRQDGAALARKGVILR
jgi:hypothetical protein